MKLFLSLLLLGAIAALSAAQQCGESADAVWNLCETGQLDQGFCACISQESADEPFADCLLSLLAANQIDLPAAQTVADLIGPTGVLERWTNSQGAACYTDLCTVPYCGEYNPQCVHYAPLCVNGPSLATAPAAMAVTR